MIPTIENFMIMHESASISVSRYPIPAMILYKMISATTRLYLPNESIVCKSIDEL